MSEIFLTDEQYKRLPYKGTEISRAKTYGEIVGLLESHGIKDYQITKFQGTDIFAFPLTIKRKDVEVKFMVKLNVPKLMYPLPQGKGKYSPKTMTYLENVSWRIFWWHLKSKLEAIEFGISDEVKEFMYNITYALPNGREVTLGDEIIENANQLSKLSQLEDNSKKPIEADYKVVDQL